MPGDPDKRMHIGLTGLREVCCMKQFRSRGLTLCGKTWGANTCLNNEEKITLGIRKSFTIIVEQLSVALKQSSSGIYKRL